MRQARGSDETKNENQPAIGAVIGGGRACPGHPSCSLMAGEKDVNARDKPGRHGKEGCLHRLCGATKS